jgi:signal transduction histidine kinase
MLSERQQLDSLYRLSRVLRSLDANPHAILQTALLITGEVLNVAQGSLVIFRADEDVEDILLLGALDNRAARRRRWLPLIQRGLVGFAQHSRRPVIARDISADPRWVRSTGTDGLPREGSAIAFPMEKRNRLYAVMTLIHPEVDYFDETIAQWLAGVSDIVSTAIGNLDAWTREAPLDEGRYRWLFEDAVVPIIITSLDGYILDVNRRACDFLRCQRNDIVDHPISAIHRMGTGPLGLDRLESLQSGRELEFRTTAYTTDSTELQVIVRARRLFFDNNDVIFWVEQDLTPQMELEQLRHDLTAMVYHDLRGPIHTIYGSFSALLRLLQGNQQPAIQDLLLVGSRSTQQLSRLVESLLDIQRLEEGKAVLDPKSTPLHSILTNAAQLVQPLAAEADQSLIYELPPELPSVYCDADMILRVVTNLMENAVKYTPMGGTIRLNASKIVSGIRISVTDSGPGIPKFLHRQIFDKFSRVKYKDAPKGIGLGLAFCRLAIEAHGGQIWVESEPNQGASFIFTLPVEKEAPAPEASAGVGS